MVEIKTTVVQDACILFDLIDLNLLDHFFDLELNVYTTIQVLDEVVFEDQRVLIESFIFKGLLKIDEFGSFDEVVKLSYKHSGLSYADCSILEIAKRKKAVIFSSDGALRRISESYGYEVRGTLWIIKELFHVNSISQEEAVLKLKKYIKVNSRVPKRIIEILIIEIQNSQS